MDVKKYFKKSGLIPAIVTDAENGEVLMLAYMNEESLQENTGDRLHMVLEPLPSGTLEQGRDLWSFPEGG